MSWSSDRVTINLKQLCTVKKYKFISHVHLNWFSHASNTWKRGILKELINSAYGLFSTDYHLKEKLPYLEKVFVEMNNYLQWLVKQLIRKVLDEQTNKIIATVTTNLPNIVT